MLLVKRNIGSKPALYPMPVNVVGAMDGDEPWLDRADFCGSVSGARESKAEVFAWTAGEAGAPLVDDAKLSMECRVEDVYEVDRFENFVCSVAGTHADDAVLTEDGKVDVAALRPVLFEMPRYTYLRTGEKIADCLSFSRVRAAEAANE